MYEIDNYRPDGKALSAAEFIKKTAGRLNFTKTHGLGSGIYGLVHGTINQRTSSEMITTLRLVNPVILDTDSKTARFIEFSQYLMKVVEEYVNQTTPIKLITADINSEQPKIDRVFSDLFPLVNISIFKILNKYKTDYNKAEIGDFLYHPINYLLQSKYDGIYNSSPNGNTFATGSVVFSDINPRHQKQAFDKEGLVGKLIYFVGGKQRKTRKKTRIYYSRLLSVKRNRSREHRV